MEKRIAIIGTVPASRQVAPFNDPEWDIWGCSPGNAHGVLPRVTIWFELHGLEDMCEPEAQGWAKPYFDWLKAQPFSIYMQERNDIVPQAHVFPIKALIKRFGRLPFTSSISMMMAMAIHMGATEIGVYGVDMAADTEAYTFQKFGCLMMMEEAGKLGIKVTVPLSSCLATYPPLYGYAEASRMGRRLLVRERETQKGVEDLTNTINRLTADLHHFRGALEDIKYMRRTFVDGDDDALIEIPEPKTISASTAPDFGKFMMDKERGMLVPKSNGVDESIFKKGINVRRRSGEKQSYDGQTGEPLPETPEA